MKQFNFKKLISTTITMFVLLLAIGTIDVLAANNAPSKIKAGTSYNVLGPYDGLYTYFDTKTYMESGTEKPAYCTDSLSKNAPKGIELTKSKELDAGYLYIIKNGYPNKSITGNANKDYYITQAAIWWYMDETGGNTGLGSSYKNSSVTSSVKSKELVEAAKKAKSAGYAKPSLSISSTNETLTKTKDGKYYESKAIAVTTKSVSTNYKVSLSGAPSGTIVVDEKGKEKTSFEPSEKFIVRVPVEKITEISYKFNATVSATGSVEKVYSYKPSDTSTYQTIVPARPYVETTPLTDSIKFSISETKVSISKQDITTKKELPGATLVIKDSKGKEIATWVSTDEPHYITGLEEGKYTLQETIAPKGYILSTETIEFEVKRNGEVTSVVMYNTKETITEEIEVPITDTTIPPFMYVLGFGIIGAGSYLVFKYSKKENK